MKRIITFIALVMSFAGMSQGLTVTTDKTPSQLINEVLVNSPCFIATNVTASTGSNFGSSNGIGYFTNTNPNFPFSSGVVLTTGDVTKVPSPNNLILSDGFAAWPGDTEMQTALLSQGININSVNASYLQFEFIATTTTFSMSFIFASEEYGASQCNYSDAFAFLIKNITTGGAYQNVGTVPAPAPAGTPVTVETIRDATYNPSCSSVNGPFFGAYNGGGFGPAINFNGQTVPMTASAPLIMGNTYRVKLVIADGNNNVGNDSAIFLKDQTLNFDLPVNILGLDYVSANANAVPPRNGLCAPAVAGSCPILQPVVPLPAGTTYQWKKRLSGVFQNIPGQTSPTLDICALTPAFNAPEIGLNYYSLTYSRPGCVAITDVIIVEVFQSINTLAVLPALTKCNTGAANYSFDLTKTAAIITTNNTPAFLNDDLFGYTITFHTSITNADSNIAVISPYSAPSGPLTAGVTMYAKIKNNISGCYVIRSFDLKVVAPPTIVQLPLDLTLCAETPSPEPGASFDFSDNISLMLGTQDPAIYTFSFHTTILGAITSATINPIYVPPTNIKNTQSTVIYVRLENKSDTGCFVTTSFTVTVTPLAYVDILPDVIVCNNFVLPALTQPGSQYWSLAGGASGGGTQLYAGDIILPGVTPTIIWVYNENGTCKTNDSFSVTKADLQTIAPVSVTVCQTDPFTLPPLAYGTYYMLAGGPSISGQTAPPANLFDTQGVKTIFVWFESLTETPVCAQQLSFTITITPYTLIQESDYPDKFACTSYTMSTPAGNGANYYNGPGGTGGMISLPFTYSTTNSQKTIYVIKESGTIPNCTSETSFTIFIGLSGGGCTAPSNVNSCTPYTLPTLDFGEYRTAPNGGGAMYPPEAVISAIGTTTIYFYVPGQPCTSNLSFDVTIGLALIAPISDVVVCDLFVLPYIASHPNGKYFKGLLGTGIAYNNSLTSPGIIYALGTQTIYFYDQSTSGPCYVQDDFQLTINPSPPISQRPISVTTCNQYFVLDDLQFGQYYKFPGGPSPTNPVLPAGSAISSNDVGLPYCEIYVYAGSSDPISTCFQEYSIKIYFVNTVVNPIADTTACDSYTLPPIVGPGNYWTATGGPLGTGLQLMNPYTVNTTITLYVFAEDNNRVACSDEDMFTVTIVKTPHLNPVIAVSVFDSYPVPPYNDPMFTFTATNPGVVTKFYKNPGGPANNPLVTDQYIPGQVITNTSFSPLVVTLYPYTEAIGTGVTCFNDEPFVVTINRTLNILTPTFDAKLVIVYKDDNRVLNINAGKVMMKNIKIYDVRGRLIFEQSNINATTTALNDLKAEQEVLLVKITSDDNKIVTKKVVY